MFHKLSSGDFVSENFFILALHLFFPTTLLNSYNLLLSA